MSLSQVMRNARCFVAALGVGVAAAFGSTAWAATCGTVSVSTTSVVFGSYNPLSSSAKDITGGITVSCANVDDDLPEITSITIAKGSSSTYDQRTMSNGTSTLNYNLYVDAARTSIWGDGTEGSAKQSLPAGSTNYTETFTVYGRIPGSQSQATAGSYSDTALQVVVTY